MMTAPSSEALLAVWERSHGAHPIARALALLDAAWPEVGADNWARAPIGQRDGCLLGLHESLFGAELSTTTRCPRCAERLESTFMTDDVRVRAPAAPIAPAATAAPRRLREQGYDVDYRLPTSEDLLAVAAAGIDTEAASRALLRRCVLGARELGGADTDGARRDGRSIDPIALPAPIVARLGEQMTHDDPEAEIRLAFSCPACGNAWRVAFDIVGYLLGELEDWAHRVLVDVHMLAGAYGWSEGQILALSPARRQLYVDMVRA
jgi:hypothetical protein